MWLFHCQPFNCSLDSFRIEQILLDSIGLHCAVLSHLNTILILQTVNCWCRTIQRVVDGSTLCSRRDGQYRVSILLHHAISYLTSTKGRSCHRVILSHETCQ